MKQQNEEKRKYEKIETVTSSVGGSSTISTADSSTISSTQNIVNSSTKLMLL
jgi:hypothetical protein